MMNSICASVAAFGWRRLAFFSVVLITLGLFGLVGVVDGTEMLASDVDHRIHDLTFFYLFATAVAGMLAQLRRPSENVAGQVMALIPWGALLLAFALTNTWIPLDLVAILGGLTLLATMLHPAWRKVFESFSASRVNVVLLALVAIAAVPLLAFAAASVGLQRAVTNDHAALGHYAAMAAFGFAVIGVGLLASLRLDGWRLPAWVAGVLPVLLGLASLVLPDVDSSLGPVWGLVAIAWGIVFVVANRLTRAGFPRGRTPYADHAVPPTRPPERVMRAAGHDRDAGGPPHRRAVTTQHSDVPPVERATSLAGSNLAIATHGLSKHFGRRKAVDDLTISVPRGTITGFVGPNGAGKTTTIRILLGLLRPTCGGARVLGCDIARPRSYLPRVGAVVEAPTFYPGLSARKNLAVLARLGGFRSARVDEVLETVGLARRANDPAGTYSLGMKQRLALAMALLPDPELLILDEPANGLDPLGIIALRDELRGLREHGKTLLISSHLLAELEQICDWLVMIREGRPVFNGPSRELVSRQGRVLVEANDAGQLDIVAQIAASAGYQTERMHSLRVGCPVEWAPELGRRAAAAGAPNVQISTTRGSLEENVLAVLKGWSS
jgi:ABC-2 type transport system ATP-binding protein